MRKGIIINLCSKKMIDLCSILQWIMDMTTV